MPHPVTLHHYDPATIPYSPPVEPQPTHVPTPARRTVPSDSPVRTRSTSRTRENFPMALEAIAETEYHSPKSRDPALVSGEEKERLSREDSSSPEPPSPSHKGTGPVPPRRRSRKSVASSRTDSLDEVVSMDR